MVKRLLTSAGAAALLMAAIGGATSSNNAYDDETLSMLDHESSASSIHVPVAAPTLQSSFSRMLQVRPSLVYSKPETCSFRPDIFTSSVFAEAIGNPYLLNAEEITALEEIIQDTYNGIASQNYCDEFNREIFNVTISRDGFDAEDDGRRALMNIPTSRELRGGRRRFFFRFFVTGTCRACSRDSKLFTDVTETRRWMQSIHDRVLQGMGLQRRRSPLGEVIDRPNIEENIFQLRSGNKQLDPQTVPLARDGLDTPGNFVVASPVATPVPTPAPTEPLTITSRRSCECAADIEDGDVESDEVNRSPDTVQFADAFNATIQPKVKEGTIKSIEQITGVAEVEEVACPSELDDFESEALIDATGNVTKLLTNPDDMIALGRAFVTAYNELAGQNCDPFFRTGINASVLLEEIFDDDTAADGELDADQLDQGFAFGGGRHGRSLQSAAARGRKFRIRFSIRGRCIGCPRNANLFDDVSVERRRRLGGGRKRRQLQPNTSPSIQTRHLGFLSEGGICFCAPGAPEKAVDDSDFTLTFDNTIQDFEDSGELSRDAIEEIDGTIQVEAPSMAPSMLPSQSPSMLPSLEPSSSPSSSPSLKPSSYPSASPSLTPSSYPSASPSLEPSSSPSVAPSFNPSVSPSTIPSASPSDSPSSSPSSEPTDVPSFSPTGIEPTESPAPSPSPSVYPTDRPSSSPSAEP